MKIKVCGMRDPENIAALATLDIDYMGLIFYPRSPRYVNKIVAPTPANIKRVGVFVDEDFEVVKAKIAEYSLGAVQLHGAESVEYCRRAKEELGVEVIKVFSISASSDFNATNLYSGVCDYFLFDTKTILYGGSGQKFDWEILDNYHGNTPFFLSGGISPDDVEVIKTLKHPLFYAIDLNSKFEAEPGIKNIEQINEFIKKIKR